MRIVYLNGQYLPETEARVSVFDRGFLMADGVYEVASVIEGKLIDFPGHYQRLQRSLAELDIACPVSEQELLAIHRKLVEQNQLAEGLVYLQITRGCSGDRDFLFPDPQTTQPTLVLFTQVKTSLVNNPLAETGIKVISVDDIRWGRRDIKTIQLLYPSMAKMMAQKAGVDDAWFVEGGIVTEGTSSNAHIIKDGRLITRPLGKDILPGITRGAVLNCAAALAIPVEQRAFTLEEAQQADEAFITSATTFVLPVIEIDGVKVGDGKPGEFARKLRQFYIEESRKAAI